MPDLSIHVSVLSVLASIYEQLICTADRSPVVTTARIYLHDIVSKDVGKTTIPDIALALNDLVDMPNIVTKFLVNECYLVLPTEEK